MRPVRFCNFEPESDGQESPAATRERLATLAQEVAGVDKAALIDLCVVFLWTEPNTDALCRISANKGASHGGSKARPISPLDCFVLNR